MNCKKCKEDLKPDYVSPSGMCVFCENDTDEIGRVRKSEVIIKEIKDGVVCMRCGWEGAVDKNEKKCPTCKGFGYLTWIDPTQKESLKTFRFSKEIRAEDEKAARVIFNNLIRNSLQKAATTSWLFTVKEK